MNPLEMSDSTDSPGVRGDFERYGLVGALTLVVLCLLLADRVRSAPHATAAPSPDRALRVRIGNPAAAAQSGAAPARGGAMQPGAPSAATTPAAPRPELPVPAPAPPVAARNCVVGDGETLGQIALRELGSSRRAREIADLNGITDLHLVRAGQTLRLPPR
jgi:hypothetical protein